MERIDRQILEAVAEGRMTPEEAAARLEQDAAHADRGTAPADTPPTGPRAGHGAQRPSAEHDARADASATGASATAGGFAGESPGHDDRPPQPAGEARREGPATRVRIVAAARTLRVIGDPSVNEAEIDGPHRAWREAGTLVVSGGEDLETGFSFRSRRRSHRDWRDWSDLSEWRRITEPLVVRVNPRLDLSVELSAGSLSVLGMHGPVGADLAAGSARFESVTGPLDICTRAGSLRIQGRLVAGSSRIRCDAGSVSVRLDPGSDVLVRAHVDLGRVRFHGPGGESAGAGDVVVGGGAAVLDIDATMASVDIMVHDPMAASPAAR